MGGWGLGPWGAIPWGLGAGVISGVSPAVVPDEGGVLVQITGSLAVRTRAIVTLSLGGSEAEAPLPAYLGGTSSGLNQAGTGPYPLVDENGGLACVVPQLPMGVYDLTVSQPGYPDVLAPGVITVVRRDFWTRLHDLRRKFPCPPDADAMIGPKRLQLEQLIQVSTPGQATPAKEGLIHSLAAALLEASGTLYTRTVPAPFASGSNAQVVSTNGADVGQIATILGRDLAGAVQTEALVLNGVVAVVGVAAWSAVDAVTLDLPCLGAVSVSDGGGFPIPTIRVGAGRQSKRAGQLHRGDTVIVVDGCYRFPDSGSVALAGERVGYSAKSMNVLCNSLTLSAALTRDHDVGAVVADVGRSLSAVDLARRMLLPEYAEGAFLDAVAARWGGVRRPSGLDDTRFRTVLRQIAFAPVGTMSVIRGVLDAVVGAGAYTVIEDLISFAETLAPDGSAQRIDGPMTGHPCTVFVSWGALILGNDARGKTFLAGGEYSDGLGGSGAVKMSVAADTVVTNTAIRTLAGVYRAADFAAGLRRSVNYCTVKPAGDGSVVLLGNRVTSAGALFLAGDVGKRIVLSASALGPVNEGIFLVSATAAGWADLAGIPRTGGYVDGAALDVLEIVAPPPPSGTALPYVSCPFGPSWAGRTIRILDTLPGAPFDVAIAESLDQRRVRLTAPLPGSGTGIGWAHQPVLAVDAALTWEVFRATFVGQTITLARLLPAHPEAVVIDYTGVKSALLFSDESANPSTTLIFPFYLSDSSSWLRALLEDLTVAGVIAEEGDPHT